MMYNTESIDYPIHIVDFNSGIFNSNQFEILLASINASMPMACLKGYGSGFIDNIWHKEALGYLSNTKTLVFDGDWYKQDSMTSIIPAFLQLSPDNRVIAFRKMGNQDNLMKSWKFDNNLADTIKKQMIVIRLHDDDISLAKNILHEIGLEEEKINYTAMGFLTFKIVNNYLPFVLSIGGGDTCVNEIKALDLYNKKFNESVNKWKIMNIARNSKNGIEYPENLLTIAKITNILCL